MKVNRTGWIRGLGAAVGALAILVAVAAFWGRAGGAGDPESDTLRIAVDLSDRELTLHGKDGVLGTYPVTIGSPRHPTPKGRYRIDWIIWNPSWHPPDSEWARDAKPVGPGPHNPMGRVKMFFRKPAYFVHGTDKDAEIGYAASHGCVRMRNTDVIEVARLVMEHGGEPRSPNWFKRVVNRFRDTREVTLARPVPIEIAE